MNKLKILILLNLGQSSSLYPNTKCEDGLNGKMNDAIGSMWYTKGEGVGGWLQINFKGVYIISKFEVRPRNNPNERNKVIELEFSDGSKQMFTILNNNDIQTFHLQDVETSYVIVKILEVYGTINNGGAFNFYGIECKNLEIKEKESKEASGLLKASGVNPKEIPALFNVDHEEVIGVGCRENLVNSKKFRAVKMSEGNHIVVNCYSSCSLSYNLVYGSGRYTKDSAICKSAFHDRKIPGTGGKVKINFGKGLRSYEGSISNGIMSNSKTYSDVTMMFEQIPKVDDIILAEGSRLDVINPHGNNFVPAVIDEINDAPDGKTISLAIEGK